MNESELSWRSQSAPGGRVIAPAGRVDEATATEFGETLVAAVGEAHAGGGATLAIDLDGIEYMSSRGLRALTLAQRRASELGVAVVLTRPNAVMREILAISRYDKVFRVFERNEDALGG